MIKIALCISIIFLLLLPVAGAKSIITIDIQENGNALWYIEQQLPLSDQTEIIDWENFIQKVQGSEQYNNDISNFRKRVKWFLNSAEKDTNRSMKVKNFNISYDYVKTVSGDFGKILYSYEWENFSLMDNDNIIIGDTFSEGMLLSADTVIIIKIPEDYEILSTSPKYDKRDNDRLIWDGTLYRSFRKGEPEVVLTRNSTNNTPLNFFLAGLLLVSSVIFWRKGLGKKFNKKNTSLISSLNPENDNLEYEEMIENILINSGGQAFQSDIVGLSKLSKSKISVIISEMKNKGRIIKIRKGKENLIRLKNS